VNFKQVVTILKFAVFETRFSTFFFCLQAAPGEGGDPSQKNVQPKT
jgi:hypothetical protein